MTPFHYRPSFNLVLFFAILLTVLAFLPLTERPTFELRDTITLNRMKEIFFLLFSAMLLTITAITFRLGIRFNNYPFYVASSFALWTLSSTLWAASPLYTFGKSLEFILLVYICTLITSIASHHRRSRTEPLGSILAFALIVGIIIVLAVNTMMFGFPLNFTEGSVWRPQRLFIGTSHPQIVADLFAVTAIVLISSHTPLQLRISGAFLAMVFLIMTNGRAPMFALVCALCAIVFKVCKTTRARFLYLISLSCLLIISFLAVLFFYGDFSRVLPHDWETLNKRIPLWGNVVDILYDHPFVGVGYFSSREYLHKIYTWAGHAHSSYLEVLLSTGLIGFGVFVAFIICGALIVYKTESFLVVGVFTYTIVAGFLKPLLFSPGIPMFILLIAMMAAAEFEQRVWELRGSHRYTQSKQRGAREDRGKQRLHAAR